MISKLLPAIMSRVRCWGVPPGCATARVVAFQSSVSHALAMRITAQCPNCGRERGRTFGAEMFVSEDEYVWPKVWSVINLPPAPPFGAGPAVQPFVRKDHATT